MKEIKKVKKKILCILQLPPPLHGASMMNSYVANSKLINCKFKLEIIDLQFSKSVQHLKKFSLRKVFTALGYSVTIIKKMVKFKPDLVYFNFAVCGFAFYRDAFYISLFKLFKSKIVLHLHTKGVKKSTENNNFKKNICTWVFKNTNVVCLSKKLASDIEDVFNSTPYIVPNGIPPQVMFNPNLTKESKKIPQILFLSNYIESKGILILIDALNLLKRQGYEFFANLVGAPADLSIEKLNQIINTKNLTSSVKVVGPLYNEDKTKEFQNADLFVFPTFYEAEAFPLVILEAFQFGLPVISTFEGGIPEMIIDNESGLLVERKNSQMLAEKIAILLSDEKLRKEIATNGFQRFKEYFTLETFELNMCEVFKSDNICAN